MKKHIALFSLVAIVFLSGCIGQGGTTTTGSAGVIIKSFSPEPAADIEPGVTVTVPILVQNVGGIRAENVQAEIIGLTDEWGITERTKTLGSLAPPDPERGFTEGQESYAVWEMVAPAKDVTIAYDITGRLYYDYGTTAESLLRVISLSYYQSLTKEQRDKKDWGISFSTYSSGPLVVTVKAPTTVISTDVDMVPLWFEIQNVGGGRVFNTLGAGAKPSETNLDYVDVTVTGSGISCEGDNSKRLIQGKSGRFYCNVDVGALGGIDPYKDISISVSITYRYYMDAYSGVTVLKQLAV